MTWNTQVKSLDDNTQLTESIQNLMMSIIDKEKCTKTMGQGANGKVYKVCVDTGCKKCLILKVALNRQGVSLSEAKILKEVTVAVPDSDPYSKHILRQIKSFRLTNSDDNGGPVWLFTDQIPRTKFATLQDQIEGPVPETIETIGLLMQTFATLAYIRQKVQGFVHMDLKPDNVALRDWPFGVASETIKWSTDSIKIPPLKYWAVILDFGLSTTKATPDTMYAKGSEWKGRCYLEQFDVFRMLYIISDTSSNLTIRNAMLWILETCWLDQGGKLKDLENITETKKFNADYSMLTALGCDKAGPQLPTYTTVLNYLKKLWKNPNVKPTLKL